MKTFAAAAVVVVAMASPALAKHCPKDAEIVNAALAAATGLSDEQKMEVKALHDKGLAFHGQGKHAESIKALHDATKILNVAPYKPA